MQWKVEVMSLLRTMNGVIVRSHSSRAAAITLCRYSVFIVYLSCEIAADALCTYCFRWLCVL